MSRLQPWLVLACLSLGMGGCFTGAEREKKAPPGVPGGLCLAPDGVCQDGMCNRDRNFCYDPQDPCEGFFCGGSDRGICIVDQSINEPSCSCLDGFETETFDLYCCPDDATQDVVCAQAQDGASSGSSSATGGSSSGNVAACEAFLDSVDCSLPTGSLDCSSYASLECDVTCLLYTSDAADEARS
ncbi:MAG: hypothetical protein KUG77_17265, partial [Nannocystaceae bacterium]|nr:hypothetical protein [Nannocystaceae bacterium]